LRIQENSELVKAPGVILSEATFIPPPPDVLRDCPSNHKKI
jgi:hypothetical protein